MNPRPRVIFVCVENSNRSQMAEAFARIHGGERVEAVSAGSRPSGRVNPKAVAAMKEVGYDLSAHQSKGLDQFNGQEFDVAVTMGCGDECPLVHAKRRLDWRIPDPGEMSPDQFREVRNLIEQKVKELLDDQAQLKRGGFMIVRQLAQLLEANKDSSLHIMLPNREFVPEHFHITEIGRVEKNFIDCGGTQRRSLACLLQVWTAHDVQHRLLAGKLANIFRLARRILESDDLPVEFEYGDDVAAQYRLTNVEVTPKGLLLVLTGRETECLAQDQCGVGGCSTTGCS